MASYPKQHVWTTTAFSQLKHKCSTREENETKFHSMVIVFRVLSYCHRNLLQQNPPCSIEATDSKQKVWISIAFSQLLHRCGTREANETKFDSIVLGFPVNSPQQMAEVRNEQQHIVTTGEFHVEYVKRQINQ